MLKAQRLNKWASGAYRHRLLSAICLVICLIIVRGQAATVLATVLAQEGSLSVEGQVTNATPVGGSVAGVTVMLHQETPASVTTLETITDAQGGFLFDGVVFDPATAYGISVRYQGALYGRGLDLSAGPPPNVALTVYDSVSSEDALTVASASLLFAGADKSAGTVSALKIVAISNTTDRTYVPGPEPMNLLRFGLPPGAQALQVETGLLGADIVQVDRGFALLASVPPGEHEVMYSYDFPYSGADAEVTESFRYGATKLRVLAPSDLATLSSDQLDGPEDIIIGTRTFQLIQGSDLPRGAMISLVLRGLPEPSFGDRLGRGLQGIKYEYAAPAGLGLIMATVIGYALWRRTGDRRPAGSGSSEILYAAEGERRVVARMIAEVEKSFEDGDLTEGEYQRRLGVLGSRLASLEGR